MKKLVNRRTKEINVNINGVEMILPVGGYIIINNSAKVQYAIGDASIEDVQNVIKSESQYDDSQLLNG